MAQRVFKRLTSMPTLEAARDLPGLDVAGFYVYFLWDEDVLVYVGQTISWCTRISAHRSDKTFTRVTFKQYASQKEIDAVERECIRKFDPVLNQRSGKVSADQRSRPRIQCLINGEWVWVELAALNAEEAADGSQTVPKP
jgi:hypothetical protein